MTASAAVEPARKIIPQSKPEKTVMTTAVADALDALAIIRDLTECAFVVAGELDGDPPQTLLTIALQKIDELREDLKRAGKVS